ADAQINIQKVLIFALCLRLLLLFSLPPWSEDYARFAWDGQLVLMGHNPYEITPSELVDQKVSGSWDILDQLYVQLNSPHYHSVYPPSNQLIFWLAAKAAGENLLKAVVLIRVVLIGFEIWTVFLI